MALMLAVVGRRNYRDVAGALGLGVRASTSAYAVRAARTLVLATVAGVACLWAAGLGVALATWA